MLPVTHDLVAHVCPQFFLVYFQFLFPYQFVADQGPFQLAAETGKFPLRLLLAVFSFSPLVCSQRFKNSAGNSIVVSSTEVIDLVPAAGSGSLHSSKPRFLP